MTRELPDEVRRFAEAFADSVSFPYGRIDAGRYKFKSRDEFFYRLRRMWRTRVKHARIWTYKQLQRIDRLQDEDGLGRWGFLDLKLREIAYQHATGENPNER